jgi:hypothetical protein
MARLLSTPSFAADVQNHQRGLATSSAAFELPQRQRPQYFATAKRGRVGRRSETFVAIVDGAEIPIGAAYPAVAWLLTQRAFSFDDVIARHSFVDPVELRSVLGRLLEAGAIVETEIR